MNSRCTFASILTLFIIAAVIAIFPGSRAQASPGFITIAAMNDPFVFVIEEMLSDFTKETGIEARMNIFSYEELYHNAIADFLEKSGRNDIVIMDIVWMGEWAESEFILPLEDRVKSGAISLNDFSPVALKGLGYWKDGLFAIPVAGFYFLFHYRKDLFDRANLPPPETFSDVLRAGRRLNSPRNNLYGIAVPMVKDAPVVHYSLAYLTGAGGGMGKEDNFNGICGPTALGVFSHYHAFLEIGPSDMLSFDWFTTTDSYLTGKVAMLGAWSVVSNMFENKSESQVAGKTGYTTLPVLEKGQSGKTPFGGWSLAINRDSSKKDASWKFIEWIVRPDIHRRFAEKSGTPVLFACLTDPELQKQHPWFELIYALEKSGQVDPFFRPRIPQWPRMEQILGHQLNSAFSGETELKTALDTSAKMLRELVK